ncbi:MAG: tRNA/rRNA methyltransferase [Candidatus Nomurabacteria bacterium GW2011_GWA2_40_9]|uniref:tRNA/rRNA methyltransferase n=1 Tax=Candidatus Nomurabacteria bacterium GW2011_GWA2_40_9 TaxID=1618734 RepID=A0A0G0WV63_9BACT|nr:MAG: tRNA/rRNA methyltransferase [Candidatus Nomurabacteria bacterium GW2011_GWA2_40_9]
MKKQKQKQKQENILIIHDVRSVVNVGAMFRTADAAGVSKIYLTGYTPAPIDRFGKKRSDFAKSALGAEDFVIWESKKSLPALISKLRREGFQIIAIEQDKRSIDYRKLKQINKEKNFENKNAFIAGPEVTGIPKSILDKCDVIAEIPMLGKKESLNVSVATGIVLFSALYFCYLIIYYPICFSSAYGGRGSSVGALIWLIS